MSVKKTASREWSLKKVSSSTESIWSDFLEKNVPVSDETLFDIVKKGQKIGYIQIFEIFDTEEPGTRVLAYLSSIEIAEEERCKGYGTGILKYLAEKHDGIYLCPENERCISLYERIGEDITESGYPDELQGNVDEYGKIFFIGA